MKKKVIDIRDKVISNDKNFIYNFMFQAIVIIYPDGTLENVPVKTNINSHLGYFKDLKENGPYFNELCRECDFEDYNCLEIRHTLHNNGCSLFVNFKIKDIMTLTMLDLPGFKVMVPNEFSSVEQVETFKKIIENYSKHYMSFYTYEEEKARKLDLEEVEEKLVNFSNRLRSAA